VIHAALEVNNIAINKTKVGNLFVVLAYPKLLDFPHPFSFYWYARQNLSRLAGAPMLQKQSLERKSGLYLHHYRRC
jgi:hypothetical protein